MPYKNSTASCLLFGFVFLRLLAASRCNKKKICSTVINYPDPSNLTVCQVPSCKKHWEFKCNNRRVEGWTTRCDSKISPWQRDSSYPKQAPKWPSSTSFNRVCALGGDRCTQEAGTRLAASSTHVITDPRLHNIACEVTWGEALESRDSFFLSPSHFQSTSSDRPSLTRPHLLIGASVCFAK